MKNLSLIILSTMCAFCGLAQTKMGLQQCRDLTLENNIKLRNSHLETTTAAEIRKNAFTNYFPKASITAFSMKAMDPLINIQTQGGNLPVYDGNPANLLNPTQFAYLPGGSMQMAQQLALGAVNVMQPVYAGGKLIAGNKLAQVGLEIKEKQEKLIRNEVLLTMEQQYWQLVALQEQEKTLQGYQLMLESVEKQVNDAFKAGLSIRNDVLKVQVKKDELALNMSKLRNGKKMALMQFCTTIGIAFDSTLVLEEPLNLIETPDSFYVSSDSIVDHRPEYELVQQAVDAAKLQTKMKMGDYLPQLAVGVNGYYTNPLEKGVRGSGNAYAYAMLSIPISDWWGGSYTIKEYRLREQIAANTSKDTKELLGLQVVKAWNDVNEAYEKIVILERLNEQADENLKVSQRSYDSGVITLTELLEAQVLKTEVSHNLIEAKAWYKLAVTAYLQASGQ